MKLTREGEFIDESRMSTQGHVRYSLVGTRVGLDKKTRVEEKVVEKVERFGLS